jgi:hypothetical protein
MFKYFFSPIRPIVSKIIHASGRSSQGTYYVSATKTNRLMICGKIIIFIARTTRNAQIHLLAEYRVFIIVTNTRWVVTNNSTWFGLVTGFIH